MQQKILGEGKQVVARFKTMLSPEQQACIGDEHFEELETLVVAAIGTMVSEEAHKAAKQVEAVAHDLRKEANLVESS